MNHAGSNNTGLSGRWTFWTLFLRRSLRQTLVVNRQCFFPVEHALLTLELASDIPRPKKVCSPAHNVSFCD